MRALAACLFLTFFILAASGCDQPGNDRTNQEKTVENGSAETTKPPPPTPPIKETFDKTPLLSLFPRVGDYRPDNDDERFAFWRTFIDHFSRVSGLVQNPETKNRAWSFRSINTIDSVAFFSPVSVEPATAYRISCKFKAKLPDQAKTGIGILEFSKFLWVPEQYTEQMVQDYLVGAKVGIELTGDIDWEEPSFVLVTGPRTRMIHLVFFRDGAHSRNPILIDDIEIRKAEDGSQ